MHFLLLFYIINIDLLIRVVVYLNYQERKAVFDHLAKAILIGVNYVP